MESSLLRMYLVNASVNSKPEKIIEFFEKLGSELQNQPEWKDWFGEFSALLFESIFTHPSIVTIQHYHSSRTLRRIPTLWFISQGSGRTPC